MLPPHVSAGYEPWLDAFWDLTTERQVGVVVGMIPASAIDRLMARNCFDEDECVVFRHAVREMERALAAASPAPGQIASTPPVASRPMSKDLFDAVFG